MPRPKKDGSKSVAASLQTALAFCSVAFNDIGPDYTTHVVLHGGQLQAFDGTLAAGHPIEDQLSVCPHGQRLRDAISRPGTGLGLTVAGDGSHLAVKLGGFACRVPCLDMATVAPFYPDPPTLPCGQSILDAFGAVAHLASNSGQTVVESSVLFDNLTMTATNRTNTVMQYWHGIELPQAFVIPRSFTQAAWKAGKTPIAIGFSDTTFTLHYNDKSWLRTQLYAETWPDLSPVFGDMTMQGTELPPDFFEACEAVLPFADDTMLLIVSPNGVAVKNDAASYALKKTTGVEALLGLPGKAVKNIAGRVNTVDWKTGERAIHFYGPMLRAAVTRLDIPQ